jgi:uncharacterized protein YjbI with pentapeptide repeats
MADFIGADLRGARFERTDLTGARLHKVNLNGAEFRSVDLTGPGCGTWISSMPRSMARSST